jgi:putative transposase
LFPEAIGLRSGLSLPKFLIFMSRPLRIEFPNAVYHVTTKGNRAEPIFVDDMDRQQLLALWAMALKRFDACALAWCLMDNHYHLVLVTRHANLSTLMRQINGTYTQAFNRRHGKAGHLFQGRFKAILVDRDKHLLDVCGYVELNPVRTGNCQEPQDWVWSSHAELIGLRPARAWLDTATVWGRALGYPIQGTGDQLLAIRRYSEFVAKSRGFPLWISHLRQQVYLGDESFVSRMQEVAHHQMPDKSSAARSQTSQPQTLAQWLDRCGQRDQAIFYAHTKSLINLSTIARELGLSTSRVSRIVKSLENQ